MMKHAKDSEEITEVIQTAWKLFEKQPLCFSTTLDCYMQLKEMDGIYEQPTNF